MDYGHGRPNITVGDEMLHRLSHELRTPLTGVYGGATTLLERWDDLDETARTSLLELIHTQTHRMIRAVEEMDRWLYGSTCEPIAADAACSEGFKQMRELAEAS